MALAARPPARTVASPKRAPRRLGYHSLRAADVDHSRFRVEQDASDAGITGQSLNGRGGNRERELHLRRRRAGQAEKGLDRARDLDLRLLLATGCKLDQGIGLPPFQVAIVRRPGATATT